MECTLLVIFYVTSLLTVLKGQTQHIELLKKHIMTILILRMVLYNPKVLKNYLVKTIIECYDW
jgi:hypothetical protein